MRGFCASFPTASAPIHPLMMIVYGLYLGLAVAGWVTIGAFANRGTGPEARPFGFLGLIIGLWTVGELMLATASTPDQIIAARRVLFLGSAGLPPTWLWVACRAARPGWFRAEPRLIALAFILPAFFYSCLYWDQSERFISWHSQTPQHGPLFAWFTFHQYALCLIGATYLVHTARGLGRTNAAVLPALVACVALPVGMHAVYISGLIENDWTAVSLAPVAVLTWISVVESGLISYLPLNRNAVVDQLDVGVLVADLSGHIVSANAAASRFSARDNLRGVTIAAAIAATEERPDALIESRSLPLKGRFGVIGQAVIMTDRTEAELSRRRLELGGRLEALGSLTAGIAHEVNNPLAFIQANLSSMESSAKSLRQAQVMDSLAPELREEVADLSTIVEETQEGVERIRTLVARLKNFSRTADLGATAVEIDLESSVNQAAAVAAIGRPGEPIRVVCDEPVRILTIETAVFQILVNLLLNAVQADPHEPEVVVKMKPDGRGVSICVEDSGPGISHSDLQRIFDPFYTTKPTGTGLGLSLSFDLVTQLGGHLAAANRDEGGAVFELWLPHIPPESSPAARGATDCDEQEDLAAAPSVS